MSKHETYASEGAAQRYVMNEMTTPEQTEFEQHYFDCLECGNEVLEWTRFAESGRAAANVRQFRPQRRLMTWLPSAAAAALVIVVGIQGVALQSARTAASRIDVAPHVVERVVTPRARSAERAEVLPAGQPSRFHLEVTPGFVSYRVAVQRGAKEIQTGDIPATLASEQIPITIRPLEAGRYTLSVEGLREDGSRSRISTIDLDVRSN